MMMMMMMDDDDDEASNIIPPLRSKLERKSATFIVSINDLHQK